jgi:hypothetical protein
MKEFEYKDIAGFEELNTARQLDTFEAQVFKAQKDRYIYDFSIPLSYSSLPWAEGSQESYVPGYTQPPYNPQNPKYKTKYYYLNQTLYDSSFEGYGIPGNAEVIFKNYPAIHSGSGNVAAPEKTRVSGITPGFVEQFDTEQNISTAYEQTVQYIEKDTAMYIDSKFNNLYGSGNNITAVKSFRSGYIEFTIKTDNQNCIIGYGSGSKTAINTSWWGDGPSAQAANTSGISSGGQPVAIDSKTSITNDEFAGINHLSLNIKNGKLSIKFDDEFGIDNSFEIVSNKTIADNEWHHIVVNFGKPGTIRNKTLKSNRRFIETWIDGKSDNINYDSINNKQIFFPVIEWLFIDPRLTFGEDFWAAINSYDNGDGTVGTTEFNRILTANFNESGDSVAFSGAMQHYVIGLNSSLSSDEIQIRYALVKGFDKSFVAPSFAEAKIVQPSVSTNKKKALKLFWNNLDKNGIELDSNFQVHAVSITHKNVNSSTETHNIDIAGSKQLNFLPDVRAVFTENVNLFGPGKSSVQSLSIYTLTGIRDQSNMESMSPLGSLDFPNHGYLNDDPTQSYKEWLTSGAVIDYPFSGLNLKNNDRILLTNQFRAKDNGIYIFNGVNSVLTRADDASSPHDLHNAVVRVTDGYYKDTSWIISNSISSIGDAQFWEQLEYHPTNETIKSQPVLTTRWSDVNGEERLVDLEQDLDISDYDLIIFMNYPETNEEIKNIFVEYSDLEIKNKYDNFLKSLKNVVANGASLYVSSPKLAEDLKIIKSHDIVDQDIEDFDEQSANINPFEFNEDAKRYFDTHRINQYKLVTEIPGLTDKETYILTDFINYIPENVNEYEQYHAKYSYRQFGLQEGNEFFIPSLSLTKNSVNEKLPGFKNNRKTTKPLIVVEPWDVLTGTTVTQLQNTYYNGTSLVNNPHDDDVTTLIVHNGQLLDGQPVNGKIFVNFVEDGYTMSREEYNKATIQLVPEDTVGETVATRAWQYSTTRLNRIPRRINVKELTQYGQTTPTNGGGGPLIQAQTNSSNGIIRSNNDLGSIDHQSDLYPLEQEEIYPIQEIPVLSMTWLGLQWLAE